MRILTATEPVHFLFCLDISIHMAVESERLWCNLVISVTGMFQKLVP